MNMRVSRSGTVAEPSLRSSAVSCCAGVGLGGHGDEIAFERDVANGHRQGVLAAAVG